MSQYSMHDLLTYGKPTTHYYMLFTNLFEN